MNSRTANPSWRWIILAFTIVVFLVVTYAAVKSAYADQLESSSHPADWLRATQIEPNNGAYWYKLGLYREWDIDNGDLNKAIEYLTRASALDPRSATYLMALGGAYETTGDLAKAKQSYLAALEDYPLSTEAHWRYGSFLLRQGDAQQAFHEIHFAVVGDRALITLAVSRVWLETHDFQPLLTTVLPADSEAYQLALEWFCNAKEPDPALATWKRMISLHENIPIQNSFPLEDLLVAANSGDDARQVWREALAASGKREEAPKEGELVFNGGFEFDAVNGGLDWHIVPTTGVKFDYDTAAPHSGRRALRLKFDGTQNIFLQTVWEDVPVESGRRYRFEGYLRTSGITSDSGIRFMITFLGATQAPIVLDGLTDDHAWTEQAVEFSPAAGVHLARIMVYRLPGQRFDNKLAGTAWVDDISIVLSGDADHQ
jgi:tetratricopeptide (TPR) repeat protein